MPRYARNSAHDMVIYAAYTTFFTSAEGLFGRANVGVYTLLRKLGHASGDPYPQLQYSSAARTHS